MVSFVFYEFVLLFRCPVYTDIPTTCRLVKNPRKPCCQIPECYSIATQKPTPGVTISPKPYTGPVTPTPTPYVGPITPSPKPSIPLTPSGTPTPQPIPTQPTSE